MSGNRIFWILGPTSSGKTTIGKAYAQFLRDQSLSSIHFDGDEFRQILGPSLGLSPEDRFKNVSLCVYMANKCLDSGSNVVVSALTAHETARQFVIKNIKNLVLIYLECPLEILKKRDSRGLYQKVKTGEIEANTVVGLESPYIMPENPHIILNTNELAVKESVAAIHNWAQNN